MNNLPIPLTDAPNVNAFESPFEKGYGAGFSQQSDIVKRIQTKRTQDQQDWSLRQNERQMNIDIWKTQVATSLRQQEMAQAERLGNQSFALQAEAQQFKIRESAKQAPLIAQKGALEVQKLQLENKELERNLSAAGQGNSLINNFKQQGSSDLYNPATAPPTSQNQLRDLAPKAAVKEAGEKNSQVATSFDSPKYKNFGINQQQGYDFGEQQSENAYA